MDFQNNSAEIAALKMDSKTTLKLNLQIQNFDTNHSSSAASENVISATMQAAESAQRVNQESGIRLDDFDMDFSSLTAGLGLDQPEEILLREVRGLMSQEEYRPALAKLEELFEIDEANHDGLYLKAVCETRINERRKALQTLRPLDGYQLKPRLQTRVQNLRLEIRQSHLPRAAKVYKQAVRSKETAKGMQILEELVEGDPGCGKYHYFLAGLHVIDTNLERAVEVARHGIEVCDSDGHQLEDFCQELDQRLSTQSLHPARLEFRNKNYRQCLEALESVSEVAKSTPLYRTFLSYAQKLAGSGGIMAAIGLKSKSNTVQPNGSAHEAEELYEYLVAPEMKRAHEAINAEQLRAAETALDGALDLTPQFATASYLYATCVYRRIATEVQRRLGLDLDDKSAAALRSFQSELQRAGNRAGTACSFSDLNDAPRLAQTIGGLIKELEKALQEFEDRKHDAKLVNEAVEELIHIVLQLTQTSFNRASVIRLLRSLQAMNSNLPRRRRKCRTVEAQQLMNQLHDLIRPLLHSVKTACNNAGIY